MSRVSQARGSQSVLAVQSPLKVVGLHNISVFGHAQRVLMEVKLYLLI